MIGAARREFWVVQGFDAPARMRGLGGQGFQRGARTQPVGSEVQGVHLTVELAQGLFGIDAAAADKRAAFAAYRGAVFQALGDAEAAYGVVAAADAESRLAVDEHKQLTRAADLAETRYKVGLASFLDVLEARRAADASGERSAAAMGRALRARVLLWQALGGGAPAAP